MVCWLVQEKVIQKYYVLEGLILKKQSILCMNSPLFGQRSSTSWVEGLPRCRSNITLKWFINTFSFFFFMNFYPNSAYIFIFIMNKPLILSWIWSTYLSPPLLLFATFPQAILRFRGWPTQALALHDGADVSLVNHARRRNVLWLLPCYL